MFTYTKTTIISNSGKSKGKTKTEERELTPEEAMKLQKKMEDLEKDTDGIFDEFDKFMSSFSKNMSKIWICNSCGSYNIQGEVCQACDTTKFERTASPIIHTPKKNIRIDVWYDKDANEYHVIDLNRPPIEPYQVVRSDWLLITSVNKDIEI